MSKSIIYKIDGLRQESCTLEIAIKYFCIENNIRKKSQPVSQCHLRWYRPSPPAQDLMVSNVNNDVDKSIVLDEVYSKSHIPIKKDYIARKCDINKWTHLKDIEIPDYDLHEVDLLIGLDAPDVLQPLEIRSGERGSLYATRTLLGWTINGPLGISKSTASVSYFVECDIERQLNTEANDHLNDKEARDGQQNVDDHKLVMNRKMNKLLMNRKTNKLVIGV